MLSRALSLAAVMLLIGGFTAAPVRAQNLEAGKSPSQIFSGTCAACHKGSRGLLRTVAPGSLPGFLRQHYTTSGEMASVMSAYVLSNGAADTRHLGTQAKQSPEAKPSGSPDQLDRFGRRVRPAATSQETAPQQAAVPDADGRTPAGERQGRNAKRRAGQPSDATPDGQPPAQASIDRGPDGRKQKLGKRGKPATEEPPKTDAAKGELPKDEKPKSDTVKDEGGKPEGTKPSEEGKSETAKVEPSKGQEPKSETPALRADPVPAVTPAPKSLEGETSPAPAVKPAEAPAPSVTASSGTQEPSAAPPTPEAKPASAAPPAVITSGPPQVPVTPAGPPAPPISQ